MKEGIEPVVEVYARPWRGLGQGTLWRVI